MEGQRKEERGMSFNDGVWKEVGGVSLLICTAPFMQKSDREIDTKRDRWMDRGRKREG